MMFIPNDSPLVMVERVVLRACNTWYRTKLTAITVITDPFAEADEDTGETKQSQNYIHIRIQRTCIPSCLLAAVSFADLDGTMLTDYSTERNGRKTLTTVQGLPKKFDQKKILKVIKKKFGRSLLPTPRLAIRLTANRFSQLAMAPSSTTLRWAR